LADHFWEDPAKMDPLKASRRLQSVLSDTTGDALSPIIEHCARGDEAAFALLYDELAGLVYGIVLKVVRNPALAEEVTQEVFTEVWRQAPRHDRKRGSVRSWVATIAHRRAVDRVRSEQAARHREEREAAGATVDLTYEVEEAVGNEMERQRVRQALQSLTEVQRDAVELAYYGGYTYREVAVVLDVPEGTVKTRIRDGLIRLRDEIGVSL
jgi:RNA polymerase sigma-70 factor (ECF subfamily)